MNKAAAAPLAHRKDCAAERQAERGGIAATAAAVALAVPEMKENGPTYDYRQQMWWSGDNIYLLAYAYPDGTVQIERMPFVSVAEFSEIAAIIRRTKS